MSKGLAAFLLVLSLVMASDARAESRFERSARRKQELTKAVVWPTHEPIMFTLRRGNHG